MTSKKNYEHQFTVNASLTSVKAFHQDTRTLKQLTPPPMFVTFNEFNTKGMTTIADFNIWIGPLPIRWVAEISRDENNSGFLDRQLIGPFAHWEHKHSFYKLDDHTTKVVDQITARPSGHPFWGIISWFMWLTLPILFAYRKWRTRRELEIDLR